jgi:cytoskeletal protein RodZ
MNDMLEQPETSEQTPGQMIKAAREAKRIPIGEVVQRLLLSKQIIAALEEDDYSKISAQVYAEGYLKAYAQFLQIPVDSMVKSFRRLNVYSNQEIKPEVKPQAEDNCCLNSFLKNQDVHLVLNVRLILMVVAGVLILSGVMFFVVKLATSKGAEVGVSPSSVVSTPEVTTVTSSTNDVTNATETDLKVVPAEEPIMDKLAKPKHREQQGN